ncbi:MAG: amino acid racemase [Candidatus Obscuribacter sp.]|nr:amino acid racemase [Candidatus Obscuribacter sp.]MBK9282391.1 amino acid racemase [Candidatus Obscuribacter sp.]
MTNRHNSNHTPKHIGIAACSAEGAALCYRTICQEAQAVMGKHAHPQISLHNHCLESYMFQLEGKGGWSGVAELMLDSAERLKKSGADFVICPDNTIHQCFDLVQKRSPLKWLHIAQVVGVEAKANHFTKLGILGTGYLMDGPVYPLELAKLDIAFETPDETDKREINRIIFDELVSGIFLDQSRIYIQDVISALRRRGCDGVILGCTELPLIIEQQDSVLPILDSTRLLARKALRYSFSK